jgi:glucokinase
MNTSKTASPRFPRVVNATQMRQINRSAILELIRLNSPIARSDIGKQLGLSLPTVMRIVDDLIHEGLVYYTGEYEPSCGRRRQLLAYNRSSTFVIGLHLDGERLFGALADIGGEIHTERTLEWMYRSGEERLEMLCDTIEMLISDPLLREAHIYGIAIGVQGLVNSREGNVLYAPALGWYELALKQLIEQRSGLPVFVENDVNLAVMGEYWFGAGQGVRNLVLLSIGNGVGAGLIIDGALYRGAHEAAGEIGYFLTPADPLPAHLLEPGPMESQISDAGVTQRARQVLANNLPVEQLQTINCQEVCDAVHAQEPWALKIVDEIVEHLTVAVANLSLVVDPELVVLAGNLVASADTIIPALANRLEKIVPCPPRLIASELSNRATVMGAIALTVLSTTGFIGRF